jgi:Zn-dependent protease with chaperone function
MIGKSRKFSLKPKANSSSYLNMHRWTYISKERVIFISTLQLILYFFCYFFIFQAQQIFFSSSLYPMNQSMLSLFTLLLYFTGLMVANWSYEYPITRSKIAWFNAWNSVRFILPFPLPFLFFVFLGDLSSLMPFKQLAVFFHIQDPYIVRTVLSFLFSALAIILILFFLPALIVHLWGCPPLNNKSINTYLEQLCEKAKFSHAGFRIWTIMGNAKTAAILGMIGQFRYVMFTDALLCTISHESIRAILAHEIGHSKYKHLIIYPFILIGMFITAALSALIIYQIVLHSAFSAYLENSLIFHSSIKIWEPIFFCFFFILTLALYFRFIFGYFSRMCERQADLYVFELHIPADHMIQALNEVAIVSGNIHHVPSWHHYSINERIEYLKAAKNDPKLISRHHRKVRIHLFFYFCFLVIATLMLGILQ